MLVGSALGAARNSHFPTSPHFWPMSAQQTLIKVLLCVTDLGKCEGGGGVHTSPDLFYTLQSLRASQGLPTMSVE